MSRTEAKAKGVRALALRFSPPLLAAVDKAVEQIAAERPEAPITRSDALRILLAEALRARKIPIK